MEEINRKNNEMNRANQEKDNFGLEKLSGIRIYFIIILILEKDLLMDDSNLKKNFDMDDIKHSNRMDLDNFGNKGISNNISKDNNDKKEVSKNKDELLNISESS